MAVRELKLEFTSLISGYPVIQNSIVPVQKQGSSKWSSKFNKTGKVTCLLTLFAMHKIFVEKYIFFYQFVVGISSITCGLWLQSRTDINMWQNTECMWGLHEAYPNISDVIPFIKGIGTIYTGLGVKFYSQLWMNCDHKKVRTAVGLFQLLLLPGLQVHFIVWYIEDFVYWSVHSQVALENILLVQEE